VPTYAYRCECGHTTEIDRPMSASNTVETCPKCLSAMYRDYRAEIPTSNGGGYEARALHSDALAIHPDQVADHHRLYPDVPLDGACRPVLTSFKQHDRYLQARGVVKRSHNREY
jgi:putative FmdB family regulatory protein